MTTTYDPTQDDYTDEADVRGELTRVFDVCQGCRRCLGLCSSFPSLFDMIDAHADRDAGNLTPAQQDRVVDECYQCKLCFLECPYTPELDERAIDFPLLMIRADAMQFRNGHKTARAKFTTDVIGRTGAVGRLATTLTSTANAVVGAEPGSTTRRVNATLTGVSSVRLLPPFARQRFSTWFRKRGQSRVDRTQAEVTVFATCLVEYQDPDIGKDLVAVFERNGIGCNITGAGCCGAPFLHSGDLAAFTRVAAKNVEILAAEVRRGTDVVVPQPTCSYVLKHDYRDHVGGDAADLVAGHTHDSSDYLMALHRSDDHVLDTGFDGDVPERITYHQPCHLRAQRSDLASRDLLSLTGADVETVQQCAGSGAMWGLRAGNEEIAVPAARMLGDMIGATDGAVVAGDCHLANTAITEQTGRRPYHPLQIVARAYGIAPES